ncbi:hypothetical protein GJR96_00175 [Haloferax sp. MBLA0076]|uniref:Uncharacterized protein n=1 Tax=Haloferax litoreum TaxID=2666140 RepID=A0A6A8GBH0_9EURY|nr:MULTISPECIES: hypothetical protein [Haloferax]KAB1191937.1 hypothetical protein Hfx1148_00175 [Haloferax sp. CBA1148]MRX20375.1 hypothetical protein [Haloferax litoreum]
MVSRENLVTLGFVLGAFPVAFAVQELTGQFLYSYATVIVIGVVIPTAINEYLNAHDADS